MRKYILTILLLVLIEGTLWRYSCVEFPFSTDYGFYDRNVYLVEDTGNTVFSNTNGQYAWYGNGWAIMYQYESPIMWGLIISDFNTKKAVEYLAPFFVPVHFNLELLGDFNDSL